MRRFRTLILILGALSLLIGPQTTPADAQVPSVNVVGLVTGRTDPAGFPPDDHSLGANRVTGPSRFRSDFAIAAAVTCGSAAEVVTLTTDHPVTFWADDDVTDGYGEVSATDLSRQFSGIGVVGGEDVTVRIDSGRFHRLLGLVEVDLDLDVRVGGCHDNNVPVRITFALLPDVTPGFFNPADPLSGFLLVGAVTRHGYVNGDRTSVSRTVCGLIAPNSTRVDLEGAGAPGGPGRGPFHPCPPEGQ